MVCCICADRERRHAIDEALIGGQPIRQVAAQFRLAKSSIHRHRTNCLKPLVASRAQLGEMRRGDQLLGKLDHLLEEALAVAKRAKRARNDALLLKALNEARDTVRLMGEFTGAKIEPPPRIQTNYTIVFQGGRPTVKKAEAENIIDHAVPLALSEARPDA